MNAEDMTPAELRALADQKEQEVQPIKYGYLKCDLYDMPSDGYSCCIFQSETPFWLVTDEDRADLITEFMNEFSIAVQKGTKFACYQDCNTKEVEWYECGDNIWGIECMDDEWAEKYLENIVRVKND